MLQYRGLDGCAFHSKKKKRKESTFGRIEDKCGDPSVQVQVAYRDPRRRCPLSGNWMRLLCNPVNVHAERVQVPVLPPALEGFCEPSKTEDTN